MAEGPKNSQAGIEFKDLVGEHVGQTDRELALLLRKVLFLDLSSEAGLREASELITEANINAALRPTTSTDGHHTAPLIEISEEDLVRARGVRHAVKTFLKSSIPDRFAESGEVIPVEEGVLDLKQPSN